ncbi:MAG: ParB N-terminal domain-containing protein [Chloroflexi bacterium]|nr:ParB N-terminal domain-containing protein [Chloroflexota bacterium]
MEVIELPLIELRETPWNPNVMDEATRERLRESIQRYGLVEPLVVRPCPQGGYEILSGNQRLKELAALEWTRVPCVVVHLDDGRARLLAQALNHIRGEDDLGLRAELLRQVMEAVPQEEVLALLPETAQSLGALASLGQEDMADYLLAWQQAQAARLKHLTLQFTPGQLEVVEEALARWMPLARQNPEGNPNVRGTALYLMCRAYLEREGPP